MKGAVISILVVLAMVQLMVKPGQAITCGLVDSSLASCIPFLTGGATVPAEPCCNGVKNIQANTPTPADRRTACNCVKAAASRYPNIQGDAASSLPQKCGVTLNIPISASTNCDNIN